jgi:transcriptional regulator with XRE-family HTH domain
MKKKINYKQPIELKDAGEEAILKVFGEKIKALRVAKDFSQDTAAFVSGLSRSYYAEIELGKRNVSLINIIKITVALDIELDELIALKESKKFFK